MLWSCASGPPAPPESLPYVLALDYWREARSDHFTILSNVGEKRLREFARELDVFIAVAKQTTNVQNFDPIIPTRIYLFRDDAGYSFFRTSVNTLGQAHTTAGGFFLLLSIQAPAAKEVLYHEYVHFLQYNAQDLHYPLWYNEGLADMLAATRVQDERVIVGAIPHAYSQTIRLLRPLPLQRVLGARSYSDMGPRKLGIFYVQSWLVTHYLHTAHGIGAPRRIEQMARYLSLLNERPTWREAYEDSFDVSVAELDNEIDGYWNRIKDRGSIAVMQLPADRFASKQEFEIETVPRAEVARELGEFSLTYGKGGSLYAARFFELALEVEPESPRAMAGQARAQALLGAWEAADSHIEIALTLDPEDASLWFAKGEVDRLRALAHAENDEQPAATARLERAREDYRRSIALDPERLTGYQGLGRSYEGATGDVQPGILALTHVHESLETLTSVTFALVKLHLQAGQPGLARSYLDDVIRRSHGGEELEEAEKLLASLDEAL